MAAYLHEMELGVLDPTGVSDRVLEALGAILGEPAERLRAAGRRVAAPGGPEAPPFARTVAPPPDLAPADVHERPADGRAWDEVDKLFRGGAR